MDITKYLKDNKLGREAFAKMIGKSRGTIYNYEKGKTVIPGDVARLIVDTSNGDIDYDSILSKYKKTDGRTG